MVAAVVGEGRKGGVTGLGGAEAQREGEDGKQAVQDRKGSADYHGLSLSMSISMCRTRTGECDLR